MPVRVLAATLVAATLGVVPTAGGVAGSQRLIVVLATWGPQPFSREQVERVAIDETSRFLADSSFGKVTLTGSVTPWLGAFSRPPSCKRPSAIAAAARAAAKRAGYATVGYDRIVYVLPRVPCSFSGHASGREVWLVGDVKAGLLAHELGHTWGLGHANRWACTGAVCRSIEYGDRFSVMGILVQGQFDAFEKHRLGWLEDADVSRATASGTYTVDQLEQPSGLPQALVITTARSEYWLDHREPLLEDAWLAGENVVGGVFVHAGPSGRAAGRFRTPNGLLPNPSRPGLEALLPGDAFAEPGAFRLTVLRHEGTHVDVDFRWTDSTAPTPPRILATRGVLEVAWQSATDSGSGVAGYEVSVDGRPPSVVSGNRVELSGPGPHGVRVVAVDRAGNRSAPAIKSL